VTWGRDDRQVRTPRQFTRRVPDARGESIALPSGRRSRRAKTGDPRQPRETAARCRVVGVPRRSARSESQRAVHRELETVEHQEMVQS